MQKLTEQILDKSKLDYVSSDTLKLISGKSGDSYYSAVKRALAAKDLIRVCRGLYLLGEKYRRKKISEASLSYQIYSPSYISFEFALNFHGLLPDIPQRILAASKSRSRAFKTPIGIFDYYHIPVEPFFLGVERHVSSTNEGFLIASPERAICDFIFKKKLKWMGLKELKESFRIDEDSLYKLDRDLLRKIGDSFASKRVKKYTDKIVGSLKDEL